MFHYYIVRTTFCPSVHLTLFCTLLPSSSTNLNNLNKCVFWLAIITMLKWYVFSDRRFLHLGADPHFQLKNRLWGWKSEFFVMPMMTSRLAWKRNIWATALNTGGGKWIGHCGRYFKSLQLFPNFEKVQDKPACNPERNTAKANKPK